MQLPTPKRLSKNKRIKKIRTNQIVRTVKIQVDSHNRKIREDLKFDRTIQNLCQDRQFRVTRNRRAKIKRTIRINFPLLRRIFLNNMMVVITLVSSSLFLHLLHHSNIMVGISLVRDRLQTPNDFHHHNKIREINLAKVIGTSNTTTLTG